MQSFVFFFFLHSIEIYIFYFLTFHKWVEQRELHAVFFFFCRKILQFSLAMTRKNLTVRWMSQSQVFLPSQLAVVCSQITQRSWWGLAPTDVSWPFITQVIFGVLRDENESSRTLKNLFSLLISSLSIPSLLFYPSKHTALQNLGGHIQIRDCFHLRWAPVNPLHL